MRLAHEFVYVCSRFSRCSRLILIIMVQLLIAYQSRRDVMKSVRRERQRRRRRCACASLLRVRVCQHRSRAAYTRTNCTMQTLKATCRRCKSNRNRLTREALACSLIRPALARCNKTLVADALRLFVGHRLFCIWLLELLLRARARAFSLSSFVASERLMAARENRLKIELDQRCGNGNGSGSQRNFAFLNCASFAHLHSDFVCSSSSSRLLREKRHKGSRRRACAGAICKARRWPQTQSRFAFSRHFNYCSKCAHLLRLESCSLHSHSHSQHREISSKRCASSTLRLVSRRACIV